MIKLSRLTDYAVAILAQMIVEEKEVWSTSELSLKTGLPHPTVSKVLKQMTKARFVVAQRGAAGGYKIIREPETITMASIIEAIDGPLAITECTAVGQTRCEVEEQCPMATHWNRVNNAIRDALEALYLVDVLQLSEEEKSRVSVVR